MEINQSNLPEPRIPSEVWQQLLNDSECRAFCARRPMPATEREMSEFIYDAIIRRGLSPNGLRLALEHVAPLSTIRFPNYALNSWALHYELAKWLASDRCRADKVVFHSGPLEFMSFVMAQSADSKSVSTVCFKSDPMLFNCPAPAPALTGTRKRRKFKQLNLQGSELGDNEVSLLNTIFCNTYEFSEVKLGYLNNISNRDQLIKLLGSICPSASERNRVWPDLIGGESNKTLQKLTFPLKKSEHVDFIGKCIAKGLLKGEKLRMMLDHFAVGRTIRIGRSIEDEHWPCFLEFAKWLTSASCRVERLEIRVHPGQDLAEFLRRAAGSNSLRSIKIQFFNFGEDQSICHAQPELAYELRLDRLNLLGWIDDKALLQLRDIFSHRHSIRELECSAFIEPSVDRNELALLLTESGASSVHFTVQSQRQRIIADI